MGQRLLDFQDSDLECLRIASDLGESVLVDRLPTSDGNTCVIAAGSLLFTARSFTTFWMWLCMGGKWYQAHICKDDVEHELIRDMRVLNPKVYAHVCKDSQFVPERFLSFLFSILSKKLKNMTHEERFATFKRVVNEID